MNYTNLTWEELLNKTKNWFDLPRVVTEAFRRLLIRVKALEDSPSGGIQTITNTDGNISIVGSNNIVTNISPALLSVINSALQSGDNISELLNDAGYITSSSLPVNTSDLINDGEDGTSVYVEQDELGAVAFSNDYNDLDNKPTIPTPISNHSELSLDDGTNPHGTTKEDVGLGNVDNTSDADKNLAIVTLNNKTIDGGTY